MVFEIFNAMFNSLIEVIIRAIPQKTDSMIEAVICEISKQCYFWIAVGKHLVIQSVDSIRFERGRLPPW